MDLEEFIEQRQQHGIIVRHDEEIDAGQICARLEIAERMPNVAGFVRVGYKDLPADGRLLPGQDVLRQRTRLELVFVEGEILDDERLLAHAGELDIGVSRPRR